MLLRRRGWLFSASAGIDVKAGRLGEWLSIRALDSSRAYSGFALDIKATRASLSSTRCGVH